MEGNEKGGQADKRREKKSADIDRLLMEKITKGKIWL